MYSTQFDPQNRQFHITLNGVATARCYSSPIAAYERRRQLQHLADRETRSDYRETRPRRERSKRS